MSSGEPTGEATEASIRQAIVAHGEEIRKLRATGTEADAARADVVLKALLELKAQFKALTGEEHRTKNKGKRTRDDAPDGDGADATASSSNAVQARRAKQPRFVKPKKEEQEKVDPMELPPGPETFPAWEPRSFFHFEVLHRSTKPGSRARVGRITTPHGVIETPCFVPVGTNAALKCLDERHARDANVQLMFCNSTNPASLYILPAHSSRSRPALSPLYAQPTTSSSIRVQRSSRVAADCTRGWATRGR